MDKNKNLPPLLLEEYEKLIQRKMEAFNLTKEEAINMLELHFQHHLADGLTREEAIMATLEGW